MASLVELESFLDVASKVASLHDRFGEEIGQKWEFDRIISQMMTNAAAIKDEVTVECGPYILRSVGRRPIIVAELQRWAKNCLDRE